MNVEILNSIINKIGNDNRDLEIDAYFKNAINALESSVEYTNEIEYQQDLSNNLKSLYGKLKKSVVNNFSPAWNQILLELGIDEIGGEKFLIIIEGIFRKNKITPIIALEELKVLYEKYNNAMEAFSDIARGFSKLKIGVDELEKEECEIGVLIPRTFIENDLGSLGNEIKELNFIFNTYSELITGEKHSFKLRNLSTSDPLITVTTVVAIAAGIAKTIGWLIDNYKKLIEIKIKKKELSQLGVKDEDLKGIEDHSNDFMKNAIEGIVKKISKEYKGNGDEERTNELLSGIGISLNKIANRIDKGFNFEVRIKIDKSMEDEKSEDNKHSKKEIKEILKASEHLQYLKLVGDPILSLPEVEVKNKKG